MTELIKTIRQSDRTGLIIMQSNAEILLARDRLARRTEKEKELTTV